MPASRLLTLALLYEVAICFALACTVHREWTLDPGVIPPLIRVPAVILLLLIMSAWPRTPRTGRGPRAT